MIRIDSAQVRYNEEKARLVYLVEEDNIKREIWFEVDAKYGKYLTSERADALVIGVLNYAMRHGHDIKSVVPITEELYYQLETELIDSVYGGSNGRLHRTTIEAPVATDPLPCAGAVGTGCSCGVDSIYSVATHTDSKFESFNVTHLLFNNVGAHGVGQRAKRLYSGRRELVESYAKDVDLPLIITDSNLAEEIVQDHLLTNTYSSCFAIHCLSKLFRVYYYASSDTIYSFSLKDNDLVDCNYYDLLSLSCFSTSYLRIYSDGMLYFRMGKVRRIISYKPSQKHLNVCTTTTENCGRCEKCVRTLLELDALNALGAYTDVFDLDDYKKHRHYYYSELICKRVMGEEYAMETYPLLKRKFNVTHYLRSIGVWFKLLAIRLARVIFPPDSGLGVKLRRAYHKRNGV